MAVVELSNDTSLGYFVLDTAMPLNAPATSGHLSMPLVKRDIVPLAMHGYNIIILILH
jgi:hypothetical protein